MVATNYLSIAAAITSFVAAQDAFYMCTENKCENCPASVISTGGPTEDQCVTYSSADTFANQGFPGTEGGGYEVFFDVVGAEPGCQTVVRSPAGTDLPGCGVVLAIFKQPVCAKVPLEKTFMLQSCCGDKCDDLGGKKIRGIGPMGVESLWGRGLGAYMLKDSNGNIIEPLEVGSPPELANAQQEKRQLDVKPAGLVQRKGRCKDNSWQGGDILTKPANNVQIVSDSVIGPADIQVSKSRTQSWSTSISAGFSFEEIFSLGVSQEMSESETSTKTITVQVAEGQSGKLGFTATMSCSTGSGECDGEEVSGEVCWPTKNSEGDVAGTYRVIIES